MKEKEVKKCRTFIGGQALMEGVMMQGATSMAMAVRTEDGDILTETKRTGGKKWYSKVPIVRGVAAFLSSLVRGTGTILRSSEVIYPEEETPSKGAYAFSAVLGVVLAIALFMLLPSFLTSLFDKYILEIGVLWEALMEGAIRILLFVIYLLLVSRLKEIRRTFMYHGAEHRTINCFEKGKELTVENVQSCSTRHNRCGTTFLFFVIIVSILVFSLTTWLISDVLGWKVGTLGKLGVRLVLLPFVAGISYELLRLMAMLPDNVVTDIFRAPGLALQKLTTKIPDDDMAEIAIISFNLVREMDADQSIKPHLFGEFTIPEMREKIKSRLEKAGASEDPDWILCEALGVKRGELATFPKTTYKQYRKIMEITKKRSERIPLDYITGKSYFYGEEITVNESVLLPRLDTEILAEEAIKFIKENNCSSALDLMTGSGCIAKAILKNTNCAVTASDVSEKALEVAKTNLGESVKLVQSDCFDRIDGKFDIIVSNPPYIATEVIATLEKEVTVQPILALDGGADGLDIYRKIAASSADYLNEGGVLMLEIGYDQRESVTELLTDKFENIECKKDLNGNDRVIIARKK
jgi:release factor-specific protein-(glutamine-N5) methyltransferase